MATGGIFQLITNDGKQDRMLMASQLLKQRIDATRARRIAAGDADCTPTLYDIERTHILFTNAHFKPFAAIGYEYNKVTSSSGTGSFGQTVQFSIPQFGDFFNDMVVHVVLSQPTITYGNGVLSESDQSLVRWCSYPGERLLKKVKFEVNGNFLDEYTNDAVNFHREFSVQPNKQTGWNRCVGQEEEEVGALDQPNWLNSGYSANQVNSRMSVRSKSGLQTPSGAKEGSVELFIPLLFWFNKDPRLSIPSVAIPYGQRFINIDLAEQDEMVGLVGRGVNASDPYGLLGDITATGGSINPGSVAITKLELYINNIFVNPEVHNIFIKRIGFTLIRVHRRQTATVTSNSGNEILLQQLKWPIEALFVGVRMSSYSESGAANRAAALDRWHKFSKVTNTTRLTRGWKSGKTTTTSYVSFASLLPAITTLTFSAATAGVPLSAAVLAAATGAQVHSSIKVGDVISFTSNLVNYVLTVADISGNGLTITFNADSNSVLYTDLVTKEVIAGQPATSVSITTSTSAEVSSTVAVCEPTIDKLTIKAHGISIYHDFPAKFYNAYLPYTYGGPNLRAPEDCGALLITFCLYPGTYQPSGHINVSRAREFYIDFSTTSAISSQTPGILYVIASAINFLLISDGSAVLRYST